jgi:hypothetical protein
MPIVIEHIERYTLTFKNGSLIISDMLIKRDIEDYDTKKRVAIDISKRV